MDSEEEISYENFLAGANSMTRFNESLGKFNPTAETLTGVKVSINRSLLNELELSSPADVDSPSTDKAGEERLPSHWKVL